MRRHLGVVGVVVVVATAAIGAIQADLFSKKYVFKPEVVLEMYADFGKELRLDNVRFLLPDKPKSGMIRIGGLSKAEVAVSNTGKESVKIGLAIAIYDDEDRLLGVASGGSRFLAIKPDRQSTYTLVFDDVNLEIDQASTFQITLEKRP